MAASRMAKKSTTIDGHLRAIMTPVSTGTIRSHGEITNVRCKPSMNSATLPCPETFIMNPATKNIDREMMKVGTVV